MPRPAPRPRRSRAARAAGLVVVVALAAGPARATMARAVPQPPLVERSGADDGQVRLTPATQAAVAGHATWTLANGGADRLTFDLAVHEVEARDDGVAIGAPASVPLASDVLTLAPGEAARIPVEVPDPGTPRALALVARTVDTEPPTTVSGVLLVGGGGPVTPSVVATDVGAGTLTVRLAATGPALVDVALRATAWPGVARAEQVVEGVLVPAGGRDLVVALGGGLVGSIAVDVVVGGAAPTRASTRVWWWPTWLLAVVATALVVATAATILVVRRRRS